MKTHFRSLMLGAALLLATTLVTKAQVLIHGHVGYEFFRSSVNIYVEDITNFGDVTTDRLRLRLWASEHNWTPEHPGRMLTTTRLPKLKPQHDHDYVRRNTHLNRPPSGWYHVTLTLEERVFAEDGSHYWEIRDVVEFEGERYIRDDSFHPHWPFD